MNNIEKMWMNLENEIVEVMELFNIEPSKFDQTIKVFDKEIKKMKEGELISFQEIYKRNEWSEKEIQEEFKSSEQGRMEKINENKDKLNSLILKTIRIFYFDDFRSFFRKKYEKFSDSVTDFLNLTLILPKENQFNFNNLNIIKHKLIFKESYSLIDRLKTEASIELSNLKIDPFISEEEKMDISNLNRKDFSKKAINIYSEHFFQEYFFGGGDKTVNARNPFIEYIKKDNNGFIKFKFKDLEKIIFPKKNILFNETNFLRNNFEHNLPTNFVQFFERQKIINDDGMTEENINKMSMFWINEYWISTIIFLYHLIKLDKILSENTN